MSISLLYKGSYPINDKINIVIPTVGEILDNDNEDNYYGLVSIITANPIDLMVQLDDAGIDFTTLDGYELFLKMFGALAASDTSLIFGDLDLSKFEIMINGQNGNIVLRDEENDITIDRAIYHKIVTVLRKIHHLKEDRRKPGNDEAKRYMLERARKKMARNKNKQRESQIESLIVAMVNTEQYKYDFESTKNLSIYQFNESVLQVIKRVEYDKRMIGVYAGTVSVKDLSNDDLNWLVHR